MYQRCQGDWNRDAGGCIIGLSVTAIDTVMALMQIDIKDRLPLLDTVQIIAGAIMAEIQNERQEQEDAKT